MLNPFFQNDPLTGWRLILPGTDLPPLHPRYRGAFEADERPPRRIRIACLIDDGPGDSQRHGAGDGVGIAAGNGACARFRALFQPLGPRRDFGVSVYVDTAFWTALETGRGWHFFSAGPVILGLWSSLPASWLAARPDGIPLPPPWRELWTFGYDHSWAARIGILSSPKEPREFIKGCLSAPPEIPGLREGSLHPGYALTGESD